MVPKHFFFGLLIGLPVGGVAAVAILSQVNLPTVPIQFVRVTDPILAEAFPEDTTWELRYQGRDFGLISTRDGALHTLALWDPSREHFLSVHASGGVFPAETVTDKCQPGRLHQPLVSVWDDDLDGIPDRRRDWEAGTMFELESIKWKPLRKGT